MGSTSGSSGIKKNQNANLKNQNYSLKFKDLESFMFCVVDLRFAI